MVNCGVDCTTDPGTGESVRVSAGNQFHEVGIAATLAIGGSVGVGVGVGVDLIRVKTDAFIDNSAQVNDGGDIAVVATGKASIISIVAGASGGEVGVAGTAGVTILKEHTFASTGTNAVATAANNVLLSAKNDTKLLLITASLAGGFVGVGVAVGVATLDKDTGAVVGSGSHLTAHAGGSGLTGIYDGNFSGSGDFETFTFHGVAVEAASSEDVFGLSASAGGGFVGVAGGVGVTLMKVLTQAYVVGGSTLSSAASVNVCAVDKFKSLTVAGGGGGGFVGVAGGVDIGTANSSVAAVVGVGSTVTAAGNVGVNALSRKDISSYAVSVGGGFVGVAGSVSVWTVGTQPVTTYNDAAGGPDKGIWFGTPDRGPWNGVTTYAQGDIVHDPIDNLEYVARVNGPDTSRKPHTNPDQWAAYYHKGDVVTDPFDSKRYAAKNNIGNTNAPHADPANWY